MPGPDLRGVFAPPQQAPGTPQPEFMPSPLNPGSITPPHMSDPGPAGIVPPSSSPQQGSLISGPSSGPTPYWQSPDYTPNQGTQDDYNKWFAAKYGSAPGGAAAPSLSPSFDAPQSMEQLGSSTQQQLRMMMFGGGAAPTATPPPPNPLTGGGMYGGFGAPNPLTGTAAPFAGPRNPATGAVGTMF